MVYVFGGLDIPLFEILLLLSIMLLAGLIIIIISIVNVIKEIKQLKSLLKEEEIDIHRFEKDISIFERKSRHTTQSNDAIKNHIKSNLQKGYTWEQIKQSLVKGGWNSKKLDEIYVEIKLK